MATFKTVVRRVRADGFYPVYIRVTHNRDSSFIKTGKMVTRKELTSSNEITDPWVVKFCSDRIIQYNNRLNRVSIENWDVKEVAEFLMAGDADVCFSDYAREYIKKMINNGQERNAKNYSLALKHLENYVGTNQVMFSYLTSLFVNNWIKTLSNTRRAKEMYPICMRQIFRSAQMELNDYDKGNIKIKTNPWIKVSIPKADKTDKLAISAEECREFFAYPIPESKMKHPLMELGRDVAMMTLCLGGINTVDLYELRKKDYKGGIISYQRAKTKKYRNDDAYMEMRVPIALQPTFNKYLCDDPSSDKLFIFYRRHSNYDSFNANVNGGIRQICEAMGLKGDNRYSTYTFRHTWATIAQNECEASISEVAFGMNHSWARSNVTRGYLKIDFSPAWELNEKVVEFIFFSGKSSSNRKSEDKEVFRLSYRYMVRGTAYHQGRKVAEITDIGFNNVDEVIDRLVTMLPSDIPNRSIVMFKIENLDKEQVVMYERMKGKGF